MLRKFLKCDGKVIRSHDLLISDISKRKTLQRATVETNICYFIVSNRKNLSEQILV